MTVRGGIYPGPGGVLLHGDGKPVGLPQHDRHYDRQPSRMSEELFKRYEANPLALDEEVRQRMGIPEDRYYTVSIWPDPGVVRVDKGRTRVVKSAKISKSQQP